MANNKTILGLESSGRNTISKSLRTLGILHSKSPPKISGIISVRIVVNEKFSLLFSEVSVDIRIYVSMYCTSPLLKLHLRSIRIQESLDL